MAAKSPTILQIVPRLDTGGAELTTLEIVSAIVAAGGRALVATAGGRMVGEVAARGGVLIPFAAATKNPVRMLANAGKLAAIARDEQVSLLHARSRAPAWSALMAARRAGLPFVTTYHGAYAENGPAKRLYNGVMARGDIVIANSHYTARLIAQRYGTTASRIRRIHRGLDPAEFDPARIAAGRIAALRQGWGVADGVPIILQAARLTGWKGQAILIEAMRLLAASGRLGSAVAVLAGDDQGRTGYAEALERQIATAGLVGRVRLVGHCTDMPAAFAASHVTVVASTEPEAFGRAATEAQAMGCPVIATAIGAPPETVLAEPTTPASGITGWLVSAGDARALADDLAKALQLDDGARAALAARARRHVLTHFSLAAMQCATLAVYDELLGSSLAAAFSQAWNASAPAESINRYLT